MKDKGKPNLDDLFLSKKLDMPDDNFWNKFQDDVKGKAIADFGRKPFLQNPKVLFSTLPVFVLAVFLSRPVFQQELQTVSATTVESTSTELSSIHSSHKLASILNEEYASTPQFNLSGNKVGNKTAFSDTRLSLASGSDVFAQYELQAGGDTELSVPANYTF